MVIIVGKLSVGLLGSRWHILCKASFISQYKRSYRKRFLISMQFQYRIGVSFLNKSQLKLFLTGKVGQKHSKNALCICSEQQPLIVAVGNEGDACRL